MIKRIDIFNSPHSSYGLLNHFALKLHEAFGLEGIHSNLVTATTQIAFFNQFANHFPEATLSFNALEKKGTQALLCDTVKIPHVSFLVESPHRCMYLTESPYSIITCIDRSEVGFVRSSGFSNVFFLPHAVEGTLSSNVFSERPYDVVLFSSCPDEELLRASWKERFPPVLCEVMDKAVTLALNNSDIPYYQAFVHALNDTPSCHQQVNLADIDGIEVFSALEMSIKAKDRIAMVRAIKDAKIHLFTPSKAVWTKYLKGQSNIIFHDAVPYADALEILKQSKIILNSSPTIRYGAHERIFAGFASGALTMTNENPYLKEQFVDGESIAFYRYGEEEKLNADINAYLANESWRQQVANQGKEITLRFHTWQQRALQLLEILNAYQRDR